MRVLIAHNRYQYRGGEDVVVEQEFQMLASSGVEVKLFEVNNDGINSPIQRIHAAIDTFYSSEMRSAVSEVIRQFKPDVLHVHNFVPRLSPSIYEAAHENGCPVVQTLHNYRLLCANAYLFRNNLPCQDCVGRRYGWPAVLHRCYRGSAVGSGVVAGMTAWHRFRGTWDFGVDKYIVLTQFAADLFAESHIIPSDRIMIKPNAVPDVGVGTGDGKFLLFVGRLSPEKGIAALLQAALLGAGFSLPLKIVGTGPLEVEVKAANRPGRIEYLGAQPKQAVLELMQRASALIFPSIWYEGMPMVIAEAFAAGLPVIANRLGSMAELITHELNGLLVDPSDPSGLQKAVNQLTHSLGFATELRRNARTTYEERYTPQMNLKLLLGVYNEARESYAKHAPRSEKTM